MAKDITDTSNLDTEEILTKIRRTVVEHKSQLGTLDAALALGFFHAPTVPRDNAASMLRTLEELIARKAHPDELLTAAEKGDTSDVQSALHLADAKQKIDHDWQRDFPRGYGGGLRPGITNTIGWTDEQIRDRLESVKKSLEWEKTTDSARKWWLAFEKENLHRLGLVLRLAEELAIRKATITEFFLAYIYSNTDNLQANLSYFDYTRLKREEEKKKKMARAEAARKRAEDEGQETQEDGAETAKTKADGIKPSAAAEMEKSDGAPQAPTSPPKKRSQSIESLGLAKRTVSALSNAGVTTVPQLTAKTEAQVLALAGIGKKTVESLRSALDRSGLSLSKSDAVREFVEQQSAAASKGQSVAELDRALRGRKERSVFDGRFELEAVVGVGEHSLVYRARTTIGDTSKVYALKVIAPCEGGAAAIDPLRKEALALVSARHKHVLRIEDFQTIGGVCFLTLEYAERGSLRDVLASCGPLPVTHAELLLVQAGEALNFIHSVGILHRSISLEHLLLRDESDVCLGGFGNATLSGERVDPPSKQLAAPEVLRDRKHDQRSELYQLGLAFYELLTGKTWDDRSAVPDLKKELPDSPEALQSAIQRLLAPEPEDRLETGRQLVQLLTSSGPEDADP